MKYNLYNLAVILITSVLFSSCASTNNLANDDVYYVPGEVQNNHVHVTVKNTKPEKGTVYEGTVTNGGEVDPYANLTDEGQDTVYLDEDAYYNIDYAARLRKFSDDNYSDDYFDDGGGVVYTSSPDVNINFGMGFGFGMPYYGYGMSFAWGYPYYGFGWGFPYYGYPYYGYPYFGYPYYGYGGSYWAGYNHGYWDGFYGYPYNPGCGCGYPYYGYPYYPDYGYYPAHYGPRGSRGSRGRTGGGSIPYSGSRNEMASVSPGGYGSNGAGSTGRYRAANSGKSISGNTVTGRPSGGRRVAVNSKRIPQNKAVVQKKQNGVTNAKKSQPSRYRKADGQHKVNKNTALRSKSSLKKPGNNTIRANRSRSYGKGVAGNARMAPRYSKPKAYRTLPSQQPRSSREYVRPYSKPSSGVHKVKPSSTRSYSKSKSTPRSSNSVRYSRRPVTTKTRPSISRTRSSGFSSGSSYSRSRSTYTPSKSSSFRSSGSYSGGSGFRSGGSSSRSSSGSSISRSSGRTGGRR